MAILTLEDLHKRFGDKAVLQGVSLAVPAHSLYGFVGRNGVGKTTTMKAILGLLKPDSGIITVADEVVHYGQTATNRFIGYLPDVPAFYAFLNAEEYLQLCGESLGMTRGAIATRSTELLRLVGLTGEKHRIGGFSRGMKQRLGIAQALLGSPRLLICDEPTSALDPIGRREIMDILSAARQQTTVLFSTHILADIERVCTHAALLNDGKIACQGTVEELKATGDPPGYIVDPADEGAARQLAAAFPGATCEGNGFFVTEETLPMATAMGLIAERAIPIRRIERKEASLEDIFVEVMRP